MKGAVSNVYGCVKKLFLAGPECDSAYTLCFKENWIKNNQSPLQ
jgi:hypothetical protein